MSKPLFFWVCVCVLCFFSGLPYSPAQHQTSTDVHVIAVDPKHQGRGAGAAVCHWGMQLSDSTGLPLYFEASPSTYKLYEKIGYVTLDEEVVHSPEVLGLPTSLRVPLMVRMPAVAKGLTFQEWRDSGYPSFLDTSKKAAPAAAVVREEPKVAQIDVVEVNGQVKGVA